MDLFLDVLRTAVEGRAAPRQAPAGTVVFRAGGLVERTAVVVLAATGSSASERPPPGPPEVADLVVWSTTKQLDDLVRGVAVGPLRVEGDRSLLETLSLMIAPGASAFATRLAALRDRP